MTAICFVCNLPILSHQVGLVWQGGNGWDDMVREQVEESTLRSRLGAGRRDSSAQITSISPPTETQETSPPVSARRRRSSLAQLTDILREWSGHPAKTRGSKPLVRRETLADLARSLPWSRPTDSGSYRKRRESSADSGVKSASTKSRRESGSTIAADIARIWRSKDTRDTVIVASTERRRSSVESHRSGRRDSNALPSGSRRGSGESAKSGRRDSNAGAVPQQTPKLQHQHTHRHQHGRRKSKPNVEPPPAKYYRDDQRPSTSSTASDSTPVVLTLSTMTDTGVTPAIPPPTISLTASITPPPSSPGWSTTPVSTAAPSSPTAPPPTTAIPPVTTTSTTAVTPGSGPPPVIPSTTTATSTSPATTTTTTTSAHPLLSTRRDSTTQVYLKESRRRDSRAGHDRSPERRPVNKEPSPNKFRLPRQSTAIDESCLPPGVWGRRGSQPTALSPDPEDSNSRKARRDSLSPDSASYSRSGRRDSRSHLSPDRSGERDVSPVGRNRRGRLRRQSTSIAGNRRGSHSPRSPDSSSTCSSRDPSPSNKPAVAPPPVSYERPAIRRQSTTEEILIARGFRRQSTTEEMIRCRNFRRQSSQSDDCCRYRGRRDSSAQITDGTLATMTVETTSTFFDSSTQTGKIIGNDSENSPTLRQGRQAWL